MELTRLPKGFGFLLAFLSATLALPPAADAQQRAERDAPTTNGLLTLERTAHRAYFAGDAASLERLLSDRFVMLGPGGSRMGKVATTRWVAEVRCDVKDGWTLDEPRLSKIDAGVYVLTYRGTFDGTCTVDGETREIPSPVRAATVWVRSGERWRAAFHGENPMFDPGATASSPPGTAGSAGREAAANEHEKTTPDVGLATPADDPDTAAMVAIETAVWEAWMHRDAEALEDRTARRLAFVDIFGNATSGKAETIEFWTRHTCDIQSARVVDGTSTPLSPTTAILTFRGILDGTCGGQEVPPIYGTSVYTREGDSWKLAFTMNSLGN